MKAPNLMNSLCIHVAHMKVSTFDSQNLALCDEQQVLGLPERRLPYSGKRSRSVDTHEVLTSIPR